MLDTTKSNLNEVSLRPRFKKSLDLQISSFVGQINTINASLVYTICFNKAVHYKWCLDKSVRQPENDLERGFAKHNG